jgi:hypothetical protein
MPLPTRIGAYRGRIIDAGVNQTKGGQHSNPKAQFFAVIALEDWYDTRDSTWYSVSADNSEITAYLVLEKNDGSINDISVRQIMDALGWSGASLSDLANTDWSNREVQAFVAEDDYNGRVSLKVKSLRPYNAEPTFAPQKADANALRSMSTRLDGKLRGFAGGVAAPAKPAPAPPARPASPPPAPPAAAGKGNDDLPF